MSNPLHIWERFKDIITIKQNGSTASDRKGLYSHHMYGIAKKHESSLFLHSTLIK